MPAMRAAKRDAAGGVERLGLDRVGEPHARARAFGEGGDERVGPVAHRQHDLVDAVAGEVGDDPLDHRHLGDRQHRLGRRERQRPEAGAVAADEDDGSHGAAVVARRRRRGSSVRRRRPTVVAVVSRRWPSVRLDLLGRGFRRARSSADGGGGSSAPFGAKAIVMRSPSFGLMLATLVGDRPCR